MEIIPVPMGFSTGYVLSGDSAMAVDCGIPGRAGSFLETIESRGLVPEDIELILITHGHSDHVGSASEMKSLTGAKIAMHHSEAKWLENPTMPPPPGVTAWGRMFMSLRRFIMPVQEVEPARVEILIGDEGMSLRDREIPGKVLWTPGHTMGSISVLLDSGDAFVGDMAMNMFPLTLRPGLPIFAEDMKTLRKSWRKLLEAGAKRIWPAHGGSFPAETIEKRLARSRHA